MKVRDVMTHDAQTVRADQTIREAAKMMCDIDSGFLPVEQNDRIVGMITDRDIAVRAIAQGKGPDTKVDQAMTRDVKYCFEDDDVSEIAGNMADNQVRRLPVLNRDKRLVGVLSLSDMSKYHDAATSGRALSGITQPGGSHAQGDVTKH